MIGLGEKEHQLNAGSKHRAFEQGSAGRRGR